MAAPVPSLTTEGFVKAIDRKCDRILMNMFASDGGQSNVWAGSVVSIQDIIYQYSDDVTAAGNNIANAMERVLSAYFDAATVSARVTEIADRPGRYDISITGSVIENMRRYDFGRMVESANGMVQKIMNNKGVELWTTR